MPSPEVKQDDSLLDPAAAEADRGEDKDRDKSSKSKGPGKTKDLSHVPCKFFRVGSCTAGSSCPFSHTALEPGQQKEVCAWFVKGNCKFGHKCALAHILPGQSMSMDRKNKKAAQAAASASNPGGPRDGHRGSRPQKNPPHGVQSANASSRNNLLSGSTAPTRAVPASRAPMTMPLKATLSPSAPAPPVQNTDFAFDETNRLPSAPAQGKSSPSADSVPPEDKDVDQPDEIVSQKDRNSPAPLPVSTPRRNGADVFGSPNAVDFGPIGSPPRASPSAAGAPSRVNGFAPGTSPSAANISTSPFSAPGTQSVFGVRDQTDVSNDFKNRSGLSASLGTMMSTWTTDRAPGSLLHGALSEVAVEEEDLEEFIPGSLTDLLTPEEKSRRMSRTASHRPLLAPGEPDLAGAQPSSAQGRHRYSRSVPAPSLLQDIRSIWSDANGAAVIGSPDAGSAGITGGGLGNGTPSSFQSNSGFVGGRVDDLLAPSNASAAFLPGLHHYINAKPAHRSNAAPGMSSLYPPSAAASHNPSAAAFPPGTNGIALSPPRMSPFTGHTTFDGAPSEAYPHRHASGRPIMGTGNDPYAPDLDDRRAALSPSARALQAHAPGQSLPQGLAAGYSRIHALPPPVIPSPSTSGAFSPGRAGGFSPGTKGLGHATSGSGDWRSLSPNASQILESLSASHGSPANAQPGVPPGMGGLNSVFSHLSYSAAASRPTPPSARNASGRSFHSAHGPLSPLSGPVVTGDDDDLFSMDG